MAWEGQPLCRGKSGARERGAGSRSWLVPAMIGGETQQSEGDCCGTFPL